MIPFNLKWHTQREWSGILSFLFARNELQSMKTSWNKKTSGITFEWITHELTCFNKKKKRQFKKNIGKSEMSHMVDKWKWNATQVVVTIILHLETTFNENCSHRRTHTNKIKYQIDQKIDDDQ